MNEGIMGRPIYARITKEGMKHVSEETHSINIDVKGEGHTIIAGSNGITNNTGDGNIITTTNSPTEAKDGKRNPAKQFTLWVTGSAALVGLLITILQFIFTATANLNKKLEKEEHRRADSIQLATKQYQSRIDSVHNSSKVQIKRFIDSLDKAIIRPVKK